MNPVVFASMVRLLPTLIATSTAMITFQRTAEVGAAVIKAQKTNLALKVLMGTGKLIGFTPFRVVSGSKVCWDPLDTKCLKARCYKDKHLLIKFIKEPGQTIQIVTGPDFATVLIYNASMVLVAFFVFWFVKGVCKHLVNFTSSYYFYKAKHDVTTPNIEPDKPLYLN